MVSAGLEPPPHCPICASESVAPTGQTVDLKQVLERWENEMNVRFTDCVWAEYVKPQQSPITLYRCAICALAFFEPATPGSDEFYRCITTPDGSCYTPQKWEFYQAIKDINKNGCRRVLDIGAGSGLFLDLLCERAPHVKREGFEFNRDMTVLIDAKGHRMHYGSSPASLVGVAQPYDAVCLFQVLEHVADPVALLSTAKQLLRENGLLLLAVPDNAGPVRHFWNALTELPPHHLSRWRASTFQKGLPRLGFQIEAIRYEPLPEFLWHDYLPVMLEHSLAPRPLAAALSKNDRLARIFRKLRLKSLPGVRGHSIYVRARRIA